MGILVIKWKKEVWFGGFVVGLVQFGWGDLQQQHNDNGASSARSATDTQRYAHMYRTT